MYYYNNQDKLKIAGLVEESIVDGPGIRFVVFTQGCPHNCEGCHNPQTHDFNSGKYMNIDEIVQKIDENPLLKGVTLSGGEPFMQAKTLATMVKRIKNKNLNVITYSGFTYEQLLEKSNKENCFLELLNQTDILIDGKFEINNKKEGLKYRGSSNQRAIDVKKSLENNKIIEYEFK